MSLPSLKIKAQVPFPTLVQATGGIKVAKSGGIWTISPDFPALAELGSISNPSAKQVWIFDPSTGIYNVVSAATLILASSPSVREKLTAARTYYVRTAPVAVAISIASPGVVTWNGHGLSANDPVVLSILPKRRAATISIASPGVVTLAGHGLAANAPIKLMTTGRLPTGVTAGTTYYVKTVIDANTFSVSATAGGAAIATTAPAFTVTIASPGVFTLAGHGLAVGVPIRLATTGALPTGLAVGTTYFVKTVPDANTFTVAATPDGAAINTSGSQSGAHTLVQFGNHRVSMTGTMPTSLAEGTVYYVKTVIDANSFTLSESAGGAVINTSGATEGTIWGQTGNDANDGMAQTRTGAWLTPQKAADVCFGTFDFGGYAITVQIADGVYATGVLQSSAQVGAGVLTFQGNTTYPGNVRLVTSWVSCFKATGAGTRYAVKGCHCTTVPATGGGGLEVAFHGQIDVTGVMEFGPTIGAHFLAGTSGIINAQGSVPIHLVSSGQMLAYGTGGDISFYGNLFTAWNIPALSNSWFYAANLGTVVGSSMTYDGYVTGSRYFAGSGGLIQTYGGYTSFPGSTAGSTDGTGIVQ